LVLDSLSAPDAEVSGDPPAVWRLREPQREGLLTREVSCDQVSSWGIRGFVEGRVVVDYRYEGLNSGLETEGGAAVWRDVLAAMGSET
jgi:hypothetical protein